VTYDRYDVEWEHPDTGRTASTGADDWCDDCDSEIDYSQGGPDGVCECAAYAV
jgi:hypothetical protein